MPKHWLVATWGSLFNRASNLADGKESEFITLDAQPEDLEVLRTVPSFSQPGCLDPENYEDVDCWGDFRYDAINGLRGSNANLVIDLAWPHAISANVSQILEIPVVSISSDFDNAIGCIVELTKTDYLIGKNPNCYRRSYIDVVRRLEELAQWMGVDTSNNEGRSKLCKASEKLYDAAKYAQDEGIRFAAVSIQDSSGFLPGTGISLFMTNPLQFSTVRTMEELGLPST